MSLSFEIERAINRASAENDSNTPDFILADFLQSCLSAWNVACNERERWYGMRFRPGQPPEQLDKKP